MLSPRSASLILLLIDARSGGGKPDPEAVGRLRTEAVDVWKENPRDAASLVKLLGLFDREGDEATITGLLATAEKAGVTDPGLDPFKKKWLEEIPKQRESRALELYKEAKEAFDKDNFAVAAGKAGEGFKLKGMPDLGFLLAESYRELGKPKEMQDSLAELAKAVSTPDDVARVGVLFGAAHLADYEASGKKSVCIDKALQNLNAALDLLKEAKGKQALIAAAHTYRARCFAVQGSLAKVDEDIAAAKAVHDHDAVLIFHQAETYYVLGEKVNDPDRSAAFQRSIARLTLYKDMKETARDPRGQFLFGLCYLRLGGKVDNFNKAKDYFSRAEVFGMKDKPELYDAWAEAFLGLGKYINAAQKYRQSFEIRPTEEACAKSGQCFIEANNVTSAKRVLQEGLDKFPKSPKLLQLLNGIGR